MCKYSLYQSDTEVQLCTGGGCDQEDSPSVWSGSCTSCQEFSDRPGTKAPPSGRSLSPGRTTGPASGRSWNVIIKVNPSACDMQLHSTADLWSQDKSGDQSPQQSSLPCRANSVSQDKHREKLNHCDFWATANITFYCSSADYFVGLFVSQPWWWLSTETFYLLQQVNTEQSGPGDDAALACLVSSQDEVGWSKQLRLSQASFGFLITDSKERRRHIFRFYAPYILKQLGSQVKLLVLDQHFKLCCCCVLHLLKLFCTVFVFWCFILAKLLFHWIFLIYLPFLYCIVIF